MEEQSSPAGVILCRTNAERCAPVGADDSVRPAVCTSKIGRTNANPYHICRGRRRALPARRPFLRYAAANLPLPHGRTGSSAPTKCFTLSPMVRTILQLCTAGSMWASTPTNGLRICIGAFVFVGVPCRADRVVRPYGCVPFRIICGVVPAGKATLPLHYD